MTFGSTRKPAELTPIMSMASICSVIRMLPISDEMFDPIFPARINAIIVEQNSRMRLSLTMYPIYILSMIGFSRLDAVCMMSTPPIKRDMTPTRRMDESISLSDSLMNCLQNILPFSGFLNTIFRKRKYRPIGSKNLLIISITVIEYCKVTTILKLSE